MTINHRFVGGTAEYLVLALIMAASPWMLPCAAFADEVDTTRPVEGLRENPPTVHALVNARIIVQPGKVIEQGTIIVRDRTIARVGESIEVPAVARRWDMRGKTVYPGLIDAYRRLEIERQSLDRQLSHWNPHVQPERSVADLYEPNGELNETMRKQGVTVQLVAPKRGIIKGTSAVVALVDAPAGQDILRSDVALHLWLGAPRRRSRDQYPNSPMGGVALARQTFHDALWYHDAWRAFRAQDNIAPPEKNLALQALQPFLQDQQLVMIDTVDDQYLQRAELFAREFGVRCALIGSGHEYRRLDFVRKIGRWVIVPVDFPKAPDVATAASRRNVTLERLMHWDHAPENAARLQEAGVPIAFTSHGLEKKSEFLGALKTAVQRGLSSQDALRALTTTPAQRLQIDHLVGSIQPGKLAHLVVVNGDLFVDESEVLETWVNGQRFSHQEIPEVDLRGTWKLAVDAATDQLPERTFVLEGEPGKLKGNWQSLAETASDEQRSEGEEEGGDSETDEDDKEDDNDEDAERDRPDRKLNKLAFAAYQLSAQFDARLLDCESGVAQISLTVVPISADSVDATAEPPSDGSYRLVGRIVKPDGTVVNVSATRVTPEESTASEEDAGETDEERSTEEDETSEQGEDEEQNADEGAQSSRRASFPVNFPLGAFGVEQQPDQPESLLFRGATVWTCGETGRLEEADVWVRKGVIQQVAKSIDDLPEDTVVIDCQGMHLTPGLIDCHSHIATDGGINESTQAITAEVRIGDFVDARDIAIYRQLAGGVTTSNILHGSANPIGGQNQVIKMRWGADPEQMKFREAPAGIKFALGENVKQSNWGDRYRSRYPQTRMGVEQIIRDAFLAARQYHMKHVQWRRHRRGIPPRKDLELEAILEVQNGERWIHCHSYRQDEILALLRTLESFGIQIGTLQHVLEGYKVADEIREHGAMASAFSDWWAYKFEVYDAIPFNGALMHDREVVVSFNSDDAELGRHLNHEAAKAVKYGGVPALEALKFVTLNPARQLRIDSMVGSIQSGKHADLVVWSGPPLSGFSRCEQTWIDGRRYFSREEDTENRKKWRSWRAALIQKILDTDATMARGEDESMEERDLWPRYDEFCPASGRAIR